MTSGPTSPAPGAALSGCTVEGVYIVLHKFKVCRNDWLSGVAKNVASRDSTIKNLGPSTALQQRWNSSIGQRWNSSIGQRRNSSIGQRWGSVIGSVGAALLAALGQRY